MKKNQCSLHSSGPLRQIQEERIFSRRWLSSAPPLGDQGLRGFSPVHPATVQGLRWSPRCKSLLYRGPSSQRPVSGRAQPCQAGRQEEESTKQQGRATQAIQATIQAGPARLGNLRSTRPKTRKTLGCRGTKKQVPPKHYLLQLATSSRS